MTITHPAPWSFVLLALSAFRAARLLGWDDISKRFRGWLTMPDATYSTWLAYLNDAEDRDVDAWAVVKTDPHGPPPFTQRRWYFAKLTRCPWCLGAWLSIAAWLLWLAWPRATLLVATPLAISATIGLIAKQLDP